MKLTNETGNKDFGHKKFAFRIDEKHQMKAIWALINLYEHKIQTPVQEIICNARDAHREVGKPDHTFKVKVTDTQFIVRDYGSGINPDKAQNIFCSIGESTKTGDNTQTGGFGIGAKSPLAYTKQFEVISYVDGTKYHYMIAKNGEALDMNLVSEEETNIVNGTKVIIPILERSNYWGKSENDKDKFIQAVKRSCYFWDTRPEFNHVIEPLEVFRVKGNDRLGYYSRNLYNRNYAVIDGIPYQVRASGSNKVVFYNTGDIRLHETRERLNDTNDDYEYNFTKIDKDFDDIVEEFKGESLEKYVDKDNLFTSFNTLRDHSVIFRYEVGDLVFTDREFYKKDLERCHMKAETKVYESETGSRYPHNYRYLKTTKYGISYTTEVFYNNTDDKEQKITRRVKNYLMQFVNNCESKTVLVLDNKEQADIFKAKNLSTLEVPKIKRGETAKQNDTITITELTMYGQNREYKKLNEVKYNYLYLPFGSSCGIKKFCNAKGYTVCLLSKENIKRVKGNEHFTCFNEWVENYKITEDEKNYIYHNASYTPDVNFTETLDSSLNELSKLAKKYPYVSLSYRIPSMFYTEEVNAKLVDISAENDRMSVLSKYMAQEYPLLGRDKKANTEYINALHSYRKILHTKK